MLAVYRRHSETWRDVHMHSFFFFFQAEDGIRDVAVTGVQTCALPISLSVPRRDGDEPPGAGRADGYAGRAAHGGPMAGRPVRRRDLPSEFHAVAPARLDFAGGWTDVPPFSAREGGVVVNAAIGFSARVELRLGGPRIRLVAEDLGEALECAQSGGLVLDGRLDLLKAALRMLPVQATCTLATRCDAPRGSGLGTSGAMDVALVAALTLARGERLAEREIAERSEEHTSELQSRLHLVCRLLLEKKKN